MSLLQFSLSTLQELDSGKAAVAFEEHVKRAALDCLDRPGDASGRKVILEVTLTPKLEPQGDCTEVEAHIEAFSKVPKHRTKAYSFGLRRGGMLVFSSESPDAIDQRTIFPGDRDE